MGGVLDVIVIGGGWSGIYALKHCQEEGLNGIILEKHSYPLGNWHYTKRPGGVSKRTFAVSSLIYMQPSDFPFPDSTPDFPSHDQIEDHMLNYIANFKLKDKIRYRQEVISVTKKDNKWVVLTDRGSFQSKYLIIATGQTTYPKLPPSKEYSDFANKVIHSSEVNQSLIEKYKDKKVLIVGGGIESCDVACMFADDSKVVLSVRSGQWFQPLIGGAYTPADAVYSRFVHSFPPLFYSAKYFFKILIEIFFGKGGSGVDGWRPKAGYFNSFYNKNRNVLRAIALGKIVPEKAIKRVGAKKVQFYGSDNCFTPDLIVFGTGYDAEKGYSFLDQSYRAPLFKGVFSIKDTSLGFVGFARPYLGSIPFISEVQSRVIGRYFAGKLYLPTEKLQIKIADKDRLKQLKMFPADAPNNKAIVNIYDYTDELADMIGAKPAISMLLSSPALWLKIMKQVHNPFVLRVTDPDDDKRNLAISMVKKYSKSNAVKAVSALAIATLALESLVLIVIVLLLSSWL